MTTLKQSSLVEGVIAGKPDAIQKFRDDYELLLTNWLISKCDDNRSREAAADIVRNLITACCVEVPSALEKYTGKGSLEGWLRRMAENKLRDYWRNPRYRKEILGTDIASGNGRMEDFLGSYVHRAEDARLNSLLREAISHAFANLRTEFPEALVLLRLVSLHGIQKQRLAAAWNCHPSQIGRWMSQGLNAIKEDTLAFINQRDPHLNISWEDCIEACKESPEIFHGE